MTLAHPRRSYRRLGADLGAILALVVVTGLVVAGCGSSSKTAATSTTGRTAQVLATVRRGDLVDSVTGRVQLKKLKAKTTAIAQVTGQNASQVAAGQSVTLTFIKLPSGVGQSQNGQGFTPPTGQSGQSPNGQGSAPPSGQGAQAVGGLGALGGKTAQGTVTAVSADSNGSVAATIAVTKLPAGVTAKYTGIAQIQVKVLASNVLIIPTAAIKGSGANATVQLLAGGKTQTQSVVVGQQTQTDSEITSGLSVGQNVVYTRTFSGQFPGGRSGQSGGQAPPQNGTPPSGVPLGGSPSGS